MEVCPTFVTVLLEQSPDLEVLMIQILIPQGSTLSHSNWPFGRNSLQGRFKLQVKILSKIIETVMDIVPKLAS